MPPARSSSAEQPHQVQRFRRGIHGRQHAPRQVVLDGADQRRGAARRPQHRIDQVRGGGLAVGPGDAGQPEALVRLAVEVARRQCQRLPAVLHLNPARGPRPRPGASDSLATATAPRASASSANLAPVGAAARKRKKQEPFSHPPRIVLQPADIGAGKLRRDWLLQPNAREYLAQSHPSKPTVPQRPRGAGTLACRVPTHRDALLFSPRPR